MQVKQVRHNNAHDEDDGDDEDDITDKSWQTIFWEEPFAGALGNNKEKKERERERESERERERAKTKEEMKMMKIMKKMMKKMKIGALEGKSFLTELWKANLLDGAWKGKSSWRSFKKQIFLTEI